MSAIVGFMDKKEAEEDMRRRFEALKQLINKTGLDVPGQLVVGVSDGYEVYPAPSAWKVMEVFQSVEEKNASHVIYVSQGWLPERECPGQTEQGVIMRHESLPHQIKALLGSVWFKDGTAVGVYAVINRKGGRNIATDTKEMKPELVLRPLIVMG